MGTRADTLPVKCPRSGSQSQSLIHRPVFSSIHPPNGVHRFLMITSRMVASLSNQLTQGSQSQPAAPGSSGASGAPLSQVGESTVEAALAVQAVRNAYSQQLDIPFPNGKAGMGYLADIVVGNHRTRDGSLDMLLCGVFH